MPGEREVRRGRRRLVLAGLAGALPVRAPAAPRSDARVGYLELVKESDGERLYRDFVEGMQAHGYAEKRNLSILRRSALAEPQKLRPHAAEFAAAKVDVIVASSTESAKAVKQAAPRTPCVFVMSGDPVFEGLVQTLARPGGMLTGVLTRGEDLTAKRLQLLKDAFPRIRTVAIVGSNVSMARLSIDAPAQGLGLAILRFPINGPMEYRDAAPAILRSGADAVLVVEDADAVINMTAFTQVVGAARRPAMFNADVFVFGEGSGLMAYGVNLGAQYRRAAALVARVLEGARPADVPVEQPTRYELVINLRVAEIGQHALPREFIARADRVFR